MYCSQCGKEIPDTSNFCPYCRTKTDAQPNTEQQQQSESQQQPQAELRLYAHDPKYISLLVGALIAGFSFILCILAYFVDSGGVTPLQFACILVFIIIFFGGISFLIVFVTLKIIEAMWKYSKTREIRKPIRYNSMYNTGPYSYNPNENIEPMPDYADAEVVEEPSAPHYDDMNGFEFEYFCSDILEKNGFVESEVTKASGDQGIDIISHKDGIKYGIQCKCYSSDIGNKAIQEAFSGKTFYNCHVGVVLTNRYFTKSAKELAEKNGIILWDRDVLEQLIENAEQ